VACRWVTATSTIGDMARRPVPLFLRALRSTLGDSQGRAVTWVLALQLFGGVLFYRFVEHWSWLDCLYFAVCTLTTVGYGDLTPTTDASKIFTMVFLISGMGILGAFVALLGEQALREYDREPKS
jgi:voltage-gated potassium channel